MLIWSFVNIITLFFFCTDKWRVNTCTYIQLSEQKKKKEGIISANWVFHGLDRRRCQQKPLLRFLPRPFSSLWGRGEERGEPDQEPRQLQVLHLRARLLPAAHVSLRLLLRQHPPQIGAGKVLSSNWLASQWVTCESDRYFLLFVSLHFQGEQNIWLPLRFFDGFIAFCDKKRKKRKATSLIIGTDLFQTTLCISSSNFFCSVTTPSEKKLSFWAAQSCLTRVIVSGCRGPLNVKVLFS